MTNQISPAQYLSQPSVMGPCFHKSDNTLAFICDETGQFQIYQTQIEKSRNTPCQRITMENERCTEPSFLDDGSLIYLKDRGGDENFQIHMVRSEGDTIKITRDDDAKHIPLFTSETGLYYYANTEEKSRFDIFHIACPLNQNEPERLMTPVEGIPIKLTPHPNQKCAVQISYGNTSHEIYLVDQKTHKVTSLTQTLSKSNGTRWAPVQWMDDHHLLVITDYFSDIPQFAVLSDQEKIIPLKGLNLEFEISDVLTEKDSRRVYFACNKEGYSILYRAMIGIDGAESIEEIPLPEGFVISRNDARSSARGMSLSSCGTYLSLALGSPVSPDTIWILNTRTFQCEKIDRNSSLKSPSLPFVSCELHRFDSFDNESVPYFKYLPTTPRPKKGYPAIFIIHGGPESQIRPSFSPVIQFFASQGFAIITPNVRGSAGYGRRYIDLDNKGKRLDAIKDIESLAHHLNQDEDIHPDNRVIFGASYGGFAVLSTITEFPDEFKAGVDIVGIADFVTFLEKTAGWRRKNREFEYGSLDENISILKRISPIHKVDHITASLFIIHGDNDERVPLSQALKIYEKLKENGLQPELLRFDDEGHGITRYKNKEIAYTRVMEWLKKILN